MLEWFFSANYYSLNITVYYPIPKFFVVHSVTFWYVKGEGGGGSPNDLIHKLLWFWLYMPCLEQSIVLNELNNILLHPKHADIKGVMGIIIYLIDITIPIDPILNSIILFLGKFRFYIILWIPYYISIVG